MQAVHHEPCRFVGDVEHAVDLMGADKVLGRCYQEQRSEPLRKRDFGALKDGPDRDGELLSAGRFIALVDTRTVRLASKLLS